MNTPDELMLDYFYLDYNKLNNKIWIWRMHKYHKDDIKITIYESQTDGEDAIQRHIPNPYREELVSGHEAALRQGQHISSNSIYLTKEQFLNKDLWLF